MKILYFALIREKMGIGEEEVTPPPEVKDVAGLLDWLVTRDGNYIEALGDLSIVRVAVNHTHVELDYAVAVGDEIAFFPPMSGG